MRALQIKTVIIGLFYNTVRQYYNVFIGLAKDHIGMKLESEYSEAALLVFYFLIISVFF